MSEDGQPATGRRASGRVRKTVDRLGAGPSDLKKKKRDEEDDENEDDDDEPEEPSSSEEESEPESEEEVPKRKRGRASQGGKSASAPRKKPAAASGAKGKGRAKKLAGGSGEEEDDGGVAPAAGNRDFVIEEDNTVFNAVRSPDAALQITVDEWVQSYQEESGPAIAELVNFLLRCCGCNAIVDEHQAEDENGIVESLSDIQDEFKNESNLAYPLVSKSKAYKKFRTSLASFLSRLYAAAASSEILYDTNFCDIFQAWIQSLSSSKIRAFRHTATVVALLTVASLNSVHVAVTKEHGQANRAKEAEQKKGRKDKARLKDLEKRATAVHERQTKVEEYLDLLYEGVFVNRYRDSDAVIRAECISALGGWMKANPDYWLEGDYLRYIGWVLSDDSKDARRESVKALFSLYAKEAHIGTLQHFTERFKGQLVHMATGELDLSVRIQAIQVLRQIETHGLLDEDQRDEIAKLVFETERRVRGAAADFFSALLGEEVEKRETELEAGQTTPKGKGKKKGGAIVTLEGKDQLQLKCLAELLVKYGRSLDGLSDEGSDDEEDQADDTFSSRKKEADVVEVKTHRGRVAFAVEALWDQVEAVRDWQAIMDFLLLDHSPDSSREDTPKAKGRKGKGKSSEEEETGGEVLEACRLTEAEETLLVEVLVASLTKVTGASVATTKKEKEKEDDVQAEVSRAVIEALPRLFAKHQTIPSRVVDILSIPRLISLDLYLDMRMLTAYEGLWDDVTKQFIKHTDPDVLDQAVQTINKFNASTTLGNTNTAKMGSLEDSLASSLREAVVGKDVESSAFEEDELLALESWLARIDKLQKITDLSGSLDDTDEGKQTSAWEIIDSLVERGRLGYKDEASLIEHAVSILGTHFIWQLNAFVAEVAMSEQPDFAALAALVAKRTALVDKLEEFSVGQNSNAAEGVKQVALAILLDLHVLSDTVTSLKRDPDGQLADLRLPCSDELQARCAGFIEAELERHSDEMASLREAEEEQDEEQSEEDEEESDDDAATRKKKKVARAKEKKNKASKKAKEDVLKRKSASDIRVEKQKEQARLIANRRFERVIYPFVRAIHSGSIDLRHSSVLLVHYERFSSLFDKWCKLLGEDLRDEGIYAVNGGELVAHVVATTLENACTLYLDSSSSDEHLVSLGRMLVQTTIVRGAQLTIIKRIPAQDHVRLHTESLAFIVKKVASLQEDKKTQARNRALSFFKALAHLLLGVEGKRALTIKNSLDSLLEDNSVEVSATSKTWEPLRAYKKRLLTAMSKDPSIKTAAQEKVKKVAAKGKGKGRGQRAASSDLDDHDDELASDNEEGTPAPAPTKARAPRKSTAGSSARKSAATQNDEEEEEEVLPPRKNGRDSPKKRAATAEDEDDIEEEEAEVVRSPAKKRKVQRQAREATAESEPVEEEQEDVEVESLLMSSPRKKRDLSEAADEIDEDEEQEEKEEIAQGGSSSRPPDSQASQVSLSDIKKAKKRARR